jgi:hypothetical protein
MKKSKNKKKKGENKRPQNKQKPSQTKRQKHLNLTSLPLKKHWPLHDPLFFRKQQNFLAGGVEKQGTPQLWQSPC